MAEMSSAPYDSSLIQVGSVLKRISAPPFWYSALSSNPTSLHSSCSCSKKMVVDFRVERSWSLPPYYDRPSLNMASVKPGVRTSYIPGTFPWFAFYLHITCWPLQHPGVFELFVFIGFLFTKKRNVGPFWLIESWRNGIPQSWEYPRAIAPRYPTFHRVRDLNVFTFQLT